MASSATAGAWLQGYGTDDELPLLFGIHPNLGPQQSFVHQRFDLRLIQDAEIIECDVAHDVAAALEAFVRIGKLCALQKTQRDLAGNITIEKIASDGRSFGAKPITSAL